MVSFSFLLPTRGRPDLARRFLRSVTETADRSEEIEVVLGVDEDDAPSHSIAHAGLSVKIVVLPPGMTMGALNRACFERSAGRYVMLINDDVIVRTRGWDSAVYRAFARYADDLALVHVNDLLFGQRLCTFPILSRKSCLEIGICPQCYRRYRIDDHIYDSYGLLGYLGHSRLVYLKDVIFEHENYSVAGSRTGRRAGLPAREERLYVPNAEVFEADSRDFENCFEDRKKDAQAGPTDRDGCSRESPGNVRKGAGECPRPPRLPPVFRCSWQKVRGGLAGADRARHGVQAGRHRQRSSLRAARTGAAREKATSAWRRYKRLPAAIHAICDPPANLLKRLVRLLLVPAEQVGLGMGIGSDEPQNQETAGRGD